MAKAKTATAAVQEAPAIALTDEMIADFTKLAACLDSHEESGKDRKEIKDKYKTFVRENETALRAKHGVGPGFVLLGVGVLRWVEQGDVAVQ